MHRANDAIPANAIRLSAPFERVDDAVLAEPKILERLSDAAKDLLIRRIANAEPLLDPDLHEEDRNAYHQSMAAELLLREALTQGEIAAYVRDPKTGEVLQPDPSGWLWYDNEYPSSGISHDISSMAQTLEERH